MKKSKIEIKFYRTRYHGGKKPHGIVNISIQLPFPITDHSQAELDYFEKQLRSAIKIALMTNYGQRAGIEQGSSPVSLIEPELPL